MINMIDIRFLAVLVLLFLAWLGTGHTCSETYFCKVVWLPTFSAHLSFGVVL